ncbi:MAG: bifunctional oligoribonuclease/PAP phosphatase NrnA [Gemmatimonadetes bacterium]|nr:bifunctional oligoribonuclease/PAP phosphatase NrnA [Gemmatimonadota bacterium]
MSRSREGRFDEVLAVLRGAERVVLTTHINADGDGAGSEAALAAFLLEQGAKAHIVNPTPFPEVFRFLVAHLPNDLVLDSGSEAARDACRAADLAVVVDTGEVPRIGRVQQLIEELPTVVIDHHPPGDRAIESRADIRDPSAAATGELVFELLERAGTRWPPVVADALFVAILTDTGGFRFSNASPRAFRVAGRLVELGARPEELHARVFSSFRLRRYRLLEAALSTLSVSADGRIAWMIVPQEEYERYRAGPDDLEGFVDVPRSLAGVEVALLFRRTTRGETKVSFRSTGAADVNALASRFGGGGHVKAAGALVDGELAEVVERVVRSSAEALDGAP